MKMVKNEHGILVNELKKLDFCFTLLRVVSYDINQRCFSYFNRIFSYLSKK